MKLIFFILSLFISATVFAVCPICTFAVGAGIGLAQYFGIDDTITGTWVGGFVVSLVMWAQNWLEKKNINFYGYKLLLVLFSYGVIIIPLYFIGIMGHDLNKLWGVDKILLGTVGGSIVFFMGAISYVQLKKNHNDKPYFPFQKVAMPVAPLIILSVLFYYLTRQ